MMTIESTVNGIINAGLNEFASEIELDSVSEYVTEHVVNEAIREFQIESITYYADLIDKDKGDNYGKLDKQLSKELLNMYDMNCKYLDRTDKADSAKEVSKTPEKIMIDKTSFSNNKMKIEHFDEPSPHNFRSVFESRKKSEKQKIRNLEKLCDEKRVKENNFTEANGIWKAYETERNEQCHHEPAVDLDVCQEIFSDGQRSSDEELSTDSSFDQQRSVEDSVDDQLLNSGFLESDQETVDVQDEFLEINVAEKNRALKPDKNSDQNFLTSFTRTIKSALLQCVQNLCPTGGIW